MMSMMKKIRTLMQAPQMISVRQFRQGNRWQFWTMSFVFAILLLFLHVFVMLASLTRHTTQGVKQKLGVYFYIKDVSPANTTDVDIATEKTQPMAQTQLPATSIGLTGSTGMTNSAVTISGGGLSGGVVQATNTGVASTGSQATS